MSLRRSVRVVPVVKVGEMNGTSTIKARETTTKKVTVKSALKESSVTAAHEAASAMPPPSTPKRKRKYDKISATQPPPFSPTPSAVGLMTASYSTGDIDDTTPPPPSTRPAQPHMTNAQLQTPGGSQILPRFQTENLEPGATTANILEKACQHLINVDPKLKSVIDAHHCRIFSPEGLAEPIDPFRSLVSGICGQQVSGAAAQSIKNKFVALFNADLSEGTPHVWPTPEQVAVTDISMLRSAGLSQRKAEYVQGLAQKFASGDLSAQMLAEASDEEVMEKLVAVRGLGKWSVEMFACFALKRLDILSTGDLGVQRGMAAYVGKDVSKLKAKGGGKWKYMSEKEMLEVSAKFAPYRSVFQWYMWRIENVNVNAIQNP